MNSEHKNRWKMHINVFLSPFQLNDSVYNVIYDYIINETSNNDKYESKILNILEKYKLKLLDKYNIPIVKSYYNLLLGDIVYELENSQTICGSEFRPRYINNSQEQELIDIFLSIIESNNIITRLHKLKKLKKSIQNEKG